MSLAKTPYAFEINRITEDVSSPLDPPVITMKALESREDSRYASFAAVMTISREINSLIPPLIIPWSFETGIGAQDQRSSRLMRLRLQIRGHHGTRFLWDRATPKFFHLMRLFFRLAGLEYLLTEPGTQSWRNQFC